MDSLGIDIGYSSVKLSLIQGDNRIITSKYMLHKGDIACHLPKCIEEVQSKYKNVDIQFGALVGSGSKLFTKSGHLKAVNDVAALVEGGLHLDKTIGSIVEIGGQSAKYLTDFRAEDPSNIKISMNSSCSAGTGSFLEEQMSRLKLKLEDYAAYAAKGCSIPRIAGRCSVFAKTDITHHQQEGVPVEDILLGLSHAMVRNYRGAVMRRLPLRKPILFVGGVAHNQAIIDAFIKLLGLKEGEFIVPPHFATVGALGAAILAKKEKIAMDMDELLKTAAQADEFFEEEESAVKLPSLSAYGANDSLEKHDVNVPMSSAGNSRHYLGVDVGSTSTNLVITDDVHRIVCFKYLRTQGNPIQAVKKGLKEIEEGLSGEIRIAGAGATGSGRHMIGKLVGADVIKDEITSQAKAAVFLDKDVDTIFEIGGQDSKYIRLEGGSVIDFQMNKICAAGTGSFLEEQAHKFNMPIHDFGNIAISSDNPIHLGERCTVFMESSIASQLARGSAKKDIVSGLCYSIVKNYINRVVGHKNIGNKIFFQGGVAYNQGVVNAFRAVTGKDIVVPPFFSVTGAYGAAILAKEETAGKKTQFKGFAPDLREMQISRAYSSNAEIKNNEIFDKKNELLIFYGDDKSIEPSKKTIGIPRALFTYGMFPMFHRFFRELGFNVLLSDPTSEDTIRRGQEYSLGEACYPVKLINGHVAELVQKKVDYIFFPDLFTVDHPGSHTRQNYGCPYMQLAFKVINQAMDLKARGIEMLAPTIAFSLGKEFMMKAFTDLGKQLEIGSEKIMPALEKGMMEFHRFEKSMIRFGAESVKQIRPDERAFVLVSKIYGVVDPVLNMGIPGKLMDMGYKVLGFYGLPEGDISREHPNMYWPFGQHILEPAQLIKAHPNLYAILLTHHGCGPDSVLSHYFREIMNGKPYLNIEVDEHSSDVGVMTRLEAFVNSLKSQKTQKAESITDYTERIKEEDVNIKESISKLKSGTTIFLPHMYPYSRIIETMLRKKGINAMMMPETNQTSLDLGRRHTLTNEYLSLTALLGDVLRELRVGSPQKNGVAFFIPQTEGAEIDGQANRFVRAKLDAEGHGNVDIVAPFIEDALGQPEAEARSLFLGLLAGDLVRAAHAGKREKYLKSIHKLLEVKELEIVDLMRIATLIRQESEDTKKGKSVLATGEPFILYNDFLNDSTFRDLEAGGHRVVYAPFSEYVWVFWRDFADQNRNEETALLHNRLDEFKKYIHAISECLEERSPFAKDLDDLIRIADKTVGYYAGAFGRYREAKVLSDMNGVDGIITVGSMYENTQITLDIVHKGFSNGNSKPILNLAFDGNRSENDQTKIDSYLYYL
jgi:predicted CoA-substrate-specific enzyme activase